MRAATIAGIRNLVWTTPAYVNGRYGSGGGVSSINTSSAWTPGIGNFLVVITSNYTTGRVAVSSVTDTAGNVYRKAGGSIFGDGNHTMECWYAVDNGKAVSNTITVNFAATANGIQAFFAEFSGVSRSISAFDGQSTGKATASGTSHTTNAAPGVGHGVALALAGTVTWGGTAGSYTGTDCSVGPTNGNNGGMLYKSVPIGSAPSLAFTTGATNQQYCGVWSFGALRN